MAANVLIGWPIYSDVGVAYTPTLSGGSWQSSLPLTNLQDRRQHLVARSSTDATADTLFTVDLGVARPVRCIALVGHNISGVSPTNGNYPSEVRVRGFSSPPILDAKGDGYQPFGTGWTAIGTPTRTANAWAANNGIYLDLLGDDDAGAFEGYFRPITYTGNAQKVVEVYWKSGTAAGTLVYVYDNTAAASRLTQFISNSGGAPSVTSSVGTLLSSTLVSNGVYRLVFLTTAVTAANAHQMEIYPAHNSAIATTGNVYLGNVCTYDSATDPLVYDSGVTAALPTGSTAESRAGWNPTYVHATASDKTARYWRVNINDDNNPAGYVQVGRVAITGGIQPATNASYGAELGWEDPSVRTETDGGATLYTERRRRRLMDLVLENQTDAEAFGTFFEFQQAAGTVGQFVFVFDPEDTTLLWKRSMLAVLRELRPVEFTFAAYRKTPFRIVEDL